MDIGFEVWLEVTLTCDVSVWFEVWLRGGEENEVMGGIIPGVVSVRLGVGAVKAVNVGESVEVEPAVVDWLDGGSCVWLGAEMESVKLSDTTLVGAMKVASAVVRGASYGVVPLEREPLSVVAGVVSAPPSLVLTTSTVVVPRVGMGLDVLEL